MELRRKNNCVSLTVVLNSAHIWDQAGRICMHVKEHALLFPRPSRLRRIDLFAQSIVNGFALSRTEPSCVAGGFDQNIAVPNHNFPPERIVWPVWRPPESSEPNPLYPERPSTQHLRFYLKAWALGPSGLAATPHLGTSQLLLLQPAHSGWRNGVCARFFFALQHAPKTRTRR